MSRLKSLCIQYWYVIVITVFAVILGLFFIISHEKEERLEDVHSVLAMNEFETSDPLLEEGESGAMEAQLAEDTWIMVDVKGHVKYPGVYELLLDSRVQDAIELAGGLTENANPLTVNLAQKLTDEMVLYIGGPDDEAITEQKTASDASGSSLVVNINEASKEELMQLNAIGSVKADNIIQYREEHGGFKTIDEIKNVSGIGDKTFENLKENLSI